MQVVQAAGKTVSLVTQMLEKLQARVVFGQTNLPIARDVDDLVSFGQGDDGRRGLNPIR